MILGVLQARSSSTRLPGKVLKPILGEPMLVRQLEREMRSRLMTEVIVATSTQTDDDPIAVLCEEIGVKCFRGSLEDVLDRYYWAALPHKPEAVVRLTGDCPLVDPHLVDEVITLYRSGDYDYVSNVHEPRWPDGLDVEVVRFSALKEAWRDAKLPSEREHVTPFFTNQPGRFRMAHLLGTQDVSHMRWTVDEPPDFELVTRIYEALYPANPAFVTADILAFLEANPEVARINAHIGRNEGHRSSLNEDLWFLEEHPRGL